MLPVVSAALRVPSSSSLPYRPSAFRMAARVVHGRHEWCREDGVSREFKMGVHSQLQVDGAALAGVTIT